MKTDRKPPLARSPMRLRNRRVLQPSNIITPFRTPSAALTKPQMKESEMRPENQAMSFELMALSKMVQDELGTMNPKNYSSSTGTSNMGPAFERGRFYDEYVARRNERLRRKQIEYEVDEPKTAYNLGVKVESSMKKDFKKKTESARKPTMGSAYVDRSQHSRYSLRSTVKRPPPLPVPMDIEEKITTRRTAAVTRTRRVY